MNTTSHVTVEGAVPANIEPEVKLTEEQLKVKAAKKAKKLAQKKEAREIAKSHSMKLGRWKSGYARVKRGPHIGKFSKLTEPGGVCVDKRPKKDRD
jgi:hypothetical protein